MLAAAGDAVSKATRGDQVTDNPYEAPQTSSERGKVKDGKLELQRHCEHCDRDYSLEAVVYSSEPDQRDIDRYLNDTSSFACLCSHCNRFSPAAMAKHFPNGYRSRLLEEINKAYRSDVLAPALIALLACLPAGIVLIFFSERKRSSRNRVLEQLSDDKLHELVKRSFYNGVALHVDGKAWLQDEVFSGGPS